MKGLTSRLWDVIKGLTSIIWALVLACTRVAVQGRRTSPLNDPDEWLKGHYLYRGVLDPFRGGRGTIVRLTRCPYPCQGFTLLVVWADGSESTICSQHYRFSDYRGAFVRRQTLPIDN